MSSSDDACAVLLNARVAVGRRGDVVGDRDRLRVARRQVRERAGDRLARVAAAGVVARGDRVDDQPRVDRVGQARRCRRPRRRRCARQIVNVCAGAAGRDRVAVERLRRRSGRRSRRSSTVVGARSRRVSSSEDACAVLSTLDRAVRRRGDVVVDGDRLRRARRQMRRASRRSTGSPQRRCKSPASIESTISRASTASVRLTLSASETPLFVTSIVNVCAAPPAVDRVAVERLRDAQRHVLDDRDRGGVGRRVLVGGQRRPCSARSRSLSVAVSTW